MPVRQLLPPLLIAAIALLASVAPAHAAPVLLLPEEGPARVLRDRVSASPTPLDAIAMKSPAPAGRRGDRPIAGMARASRGPTVRGELRRMLRRGAIDRVQYAAHRAAYDEAWQLGDRLPGRRGVEMHGVVARIDAITARRELTPSRLGPLWLTLRRNAEWWREGALLSSGQRVQFEGSEVLWQYVPGQGLHVHPLASFGKLNGLWQGGRRYEARMSALMDELLALRVERAGGVAWEYYFDFGVAAAPWVSGMAQATGLQAFARASEQLGRQADVLPVAQAGLGIFERRAPEGVRVRSGGGNHYLLYSGDRRLRVLNGFVQALSGLDEYAHRASDPRARELYTAGRRALAAEMRAADTGAWSLYSLGRVSQEASLSYHQLVTGFLGNLCERTGDGLYCDGRTRFAGYLTQPPELRVTTPRLRAGRSGEVRFRLSKRSAVSVSLSRGGRVVLQRSLGTLPYGRRSIAVTPPRGAGDYTVALSAVDMAGNPGATSADVQVLPARRARRGRD
jgi:hypothetical protein